MGAKDRTIASMASQSHGVVTRRELLAAGLSRREIQRRIERGSLLVVYRGVYRVGHRAPSVEAQYLAAVRACGEGAVLSGRAAAHLYRLLTAVAMPEVTAPTERRVASVITHRSRSAIVKTTHRGIPITT